MQINMLEIVKILVEIPEIAREFQPPKPLYSDPSCIVISRFDCSLLKNFGVPGPSLKIVGF
jgi:hypothetical protein